MRNSLGSYRCHTDAQRIEPGAALVLLMAGPATNAATITMIAKVMGRKSLAGYLGSIISGALLFGFMINNFLPGSWFILPEHITSHEHEILHGWLSIGSGIILVLLIMNGYNEIIQKETRRERKGQCFPRE